MNEIKSLFKSLRHDEMRSTISKMWLEDFYHFVCDLNPITTSMMKHILKIEADMRTIQVIYNSMGNEKFANPSER